MRRRLRITTTGIALAVAALWLCNNWTMPALLLASVDDQPATGREVDKTTATAPSGVQPSTRARTEMAHAGEQQRVSSAAAEPLRSTTMDQPPAALELQTLAACLLSVPPTTPVSLEDVIAGKSPE